MERKLAADRKEMQRAWVFRSLEKRPAKLESLLTLLAQLEHPRRMGERKAGRVARVGGVGQGSRTGAGGCR